MTTIIKRRQVYHYIYTQTHNSYHYMQNNRNNNFFKQHIPLYIYVLINISYCKNENGCIVYLCV